MSEQEAEDKRAKQLEEARKRVEALKKKKKNKKNKNKKDTKKDETEESTQPTPAPEELNNEGEVASSIEVTTGIEPTEEKLACDH